MLILNRMILLIFVGGALLYSGCASDRGTDMSALLADLEIAEIDYVDDVGPNTPAKPLDELPVPAPPHNNGEPKDSRGSGELTIQPDCLLKVRVKEDSSLDGNYNVNEIGAIELKYIGPVILYDKTEDEAEQKIQEVLRNRDFRNATVHVNIIRASYDKVRIRGAVNNPGVIKIGAGDSISLNDILLRAGGLRSTARGVQVKIVRKGMRTAVAPSLDGEEYQLVAEDGQPQVPDIRLQNSDDVYVYSTKTEPSVEVGEKEITVLGEVKRQGVYRFTGAEPCTVMHLIFKMGGLPPYADASRIKLIRQDKDGIETEIEVDAGEILEKGNPDKDIRLKSGDRLVVPARKIHLF